MTEHKVITLDTGDIVYELDGQEYIDTNQAYAVLLAEEAIVISLPKIFVNCSDFFMWGSSDGEEFNESELISIYKMYLRDPEWGTSLWVAIKRKELPQSVVELRIREAGVWDLDAFAKEHNLRANLYSGVSQVIAKHKLELVNAWRHGNGLEPLPFTKEWWALGWNPYILEHPNWESTEFLAESRSRVKEWKELNGW